MLCRWLDRLAGADGSVQATLEARNVKHEAVPDGKPASTSSHLRMRLHALLEDLCALTPAAALNSVQMDYCCV